MSNMNDSYQQSPPYDPMSALRPLPQSKYIQDSLQNMPQEMRSPHFGDFQKQTVMTNQTEFDKELERLKEQMWDAAQLNKDNPLGYHIFDAHFNTFKQAVDKYVIGKDEYRTGMVGSDYEMTRYSDDKKAQSRLALWGDK